MPTVTATIVAGTIVTSYMANKAGNKMTSAANAQAAEQLKFQKEQQVKLDKQKEIYKQF